MLCGSFQIVQGIWTGLPQRAASRQQPPPGAGVAMASPEPVVVAREQLLHATFLRCFFLLPPCCLIPAAVSNSCDTAAGCMRHSIASRWPIPCDVLAADTGQLHQCTTTPWEAKRGGHGFRTNRTLQAIAVLLSLWPQLCCLRRAHQNYWAAPFAAPSVPTPPTFQPRSLLATLASLFPPKS